MPKTGLLVRRTIIVAVALTVVLCEGASACTNTAGSTGAISVTPSPSVHEALLAPVAGAPLWSRVGPNVPTGFNLGSINTGRANQRVTAEIVAAMGGTIGRQSISWKLTQKDKNVLTGACPYDWSRSDSAYAALVSHGIRPLWVISDAPQWANLLGGCTDQSAQCSMPPDSSHYVDYVDFVRAVAQRYPLAAAVEVWNEPNMGRFWKNPDPVAYDQLLHATWDGMRTTDPAMRVLGGALSPIPYDTHDASGRPIIGLGHFLDQMQADGAFAWMHGFSFHPYPGQPSPDIFKATFATLASYPGLADQRLVPDELGIPTSVQATVWSNHDQCAQLVDEFDWLDSGSPDLLPGNTLWQHVDSVLFHTETQSTTSSDGFGFGDISGSDTTDYDYAPRPVYLELQRALTSSPAEVPGSANCGSALGAPIPYPANVDRTG
jgi:hypothetical protein